MNKYDLEHVTHRASEDVEGGMGAAPTSYAWETYYTPEHMETVMRRAVATGISPGKMMFLLHLVLWLRDDREDPPAARAAICGARCAPTGDRDCRSRTCCASIRNTSPTW